MLHSLAPTLQSLVRTATMDAWGQHCLFLFLLRNVALNESKLRAGAGAAVVLAGYAGPPLRRI